MTVSFFAPGLPVPKGSTRSFGRVLPNGKVAVATTSTSKGLKSWEGTVALAAMQAKAKMLEGPVVVRLIFRLPRPKGHYTGKGELKPSALAVSEKKPDLDKLIRAVLDALTGVCWRDDAQVCYLAAEKRYAGSACGVEVLIEGY